MFQTEAAAKVGGTSPNVLSKCLLPAQVRQEAECKTLMMLYMEMSPLVCNLITGY